MSSTHMHLMKLSGSGDPNTPVMIGDGASGSVYLVSDGRVVKRPNPVALTIPSITLEGIMTSLQWEKRIYERLGCHDRIIQFYGWLPEPDGGLLLELAPNRCIETYIVSIMPELPTRYKWCNQVAQALEFIHDKSVLHGDLNFGNILLTAALDIKVCDFGGSSIDGSLYRTSALPPFASAWSFNQEPRPQDDIFSLGTFIYAMTVGELPLHEVETFSDVLRLWAERYPSVPDYVDPRLRDILLRCWKEDYTSAASVTEEFCKITSQLSSHPLLDHDDANRLYRSPKWKY